MNEKLKKTAVRLIPYLFVALAATCLGKAWRMAEDADVTQTLLNLPKTLEAAFSPPIPSLHPIDLLTGAVTAAMLRAAVYFKGKTPANTERTVNTVPPDGARARTSRPISTRCFRKT